MAGEQNKLDASCNTHAHATILDLVRLGTVGESNHDHAIDEILRRLKTYFDLPRVAVCLIDSGRYSVKCLIDDTGAYQVGDVLPMAGSWCEQVVEQEGSVLAVCKDGQDFAAYPGLLTENARTYAGAPIMADGQLQGTLNVTASEPRATAFDAGDREVLDVAAALVGHHLSLQRAEQRFELAIRGSSVGFWEWDVRTGAIFWSPRYLEILGLQDTNIARALKDFEDRQHPDDRAPIREAMQAHLDRREPYDIEYRLRREDGDYIWVHARGQAAWDAAGVPQRMAGSVDDITARKTAELRIQRQADALQRANRELEQFAAITSHDLQEPLRKIASFGALLTRDYADRLDDRGRVLVDRMVDGAQRLRQLVQDLLDYSRSSNDAMQIDDIPLDGLIAELCGDFEVVIGETGAVIECQSDVVLRGDRVLVRQMFQNLLSNALKYRSDAAPHIRITADRLEAQSGWRLRIQDNGIGFSSRHAKRVFEIFKRLHPRDQYPGTGIGLALCQRVAERHGGRIWAESEPGQGTCILMDWPFAPGEGLATVTAEPAKPADGK